MGWTNDAATSLVVPTGATSGKRVVIDGTTDEIDAYSDANVQVVRIDGTGVWVGDPTGSSVFVAHQGTGGEIILTPVQPTGDPAGGTIDGAVFAVSQSGSPDYRGQVTLTSPSYSTSHGNAGNSQIVLSGGGATGNTTSEIDLNADVIQVSKPIGLKGEAWQAATLLNGWTDRGNGLGYSVKHFRKIAGENALHIRANLNQGSQYSDGTGILQLPAAYQPLFKTTWPGGKNSGAGPSFEISPDGIIRIYGHLAGNVAQFNTVVPLD